MDYLTKLPTTVPAGRYLVHNQVYPVARHHGMRGSRCWLQADLVDREPCPCGWAPELGLHYRVATNEKREP
jgi:hypothetical protein